MGSREASQKGSARRARGAVLIYAAVVALAAVIVYANSLANRFAYDDVPIIEESERVHQFQGQAKIWLTPYWTDPGGRTRGAYRPLTIFAFAVEWALGGGSPLLFHAVNVALHAVVSVLVLLLLARLTSPSAGFVGALLFSVHPVHVEAVANVVGQAELLSTAAMLAACLLYVRRAPPPTEPYPLAAIGALYLAALLVKENSIVLPGLLVVLDVALRRHGGTREEVVRYSRSIAPLFILLIAIASAYLTLRFVVLGGVGSEGTSQSLPFLRQPATRVLTALRTWPEYLRLFVFPASLAATDESALRLSGGSVDVRVQLGGLLLLGTVAAAALSPRRPRLWPAAWFLVAIFTVSNLAFPVGIVLAERTLYLPSVALAGALAISWRLLPDAPRARATAGAAFATVLLLMAGRTALRNPDWRTTDSVFAATLRDHPNSMFSQWHLAKDALERGDTATADWYWRRALTRGPRFPDLLSEYGVEELKRGRTASAIRYMERARTLRKLYARNDFYLGLAYLRGGDLGRARQVVHRLDSQGYREVADWLGDSIASRAPPDSVNGSATAR